VEDDRKVAGFIEQGLREEGYAVDVAPDGDEATMLAHVYDYDLVVLDVMLPKKNGLQVAAELRREGRRTPILMLTARDATEDVVRGLEQGPTTTLPSPSSSRSCWHASGRGAPRRRGLHRFRHGPIELDRLKQGAVQGKPVDLTSKEFHLLQHFPLHRGGRCARAARKSVGHALIREQRGRCAWATGASARPPGNDPSTERGVGSVSAA
jgi:DNA-binding response OmpR family regulator